MPGPPEGSLAVLIKSAGLSRSSWTRPPWELLGSTSPICPANAEKYLVEHSSVVRYCRCDNLRQRSHLLLPWRGLRWPHPEHPVGSGVAPESIQAVSAVRVAGG